METIKLNYESLLKMINSNDTENKTVALEAMKNANVKENFVCLSLLLKFGDISNDDLHYLSEIGKLYDFKFNNITFGLIYDKMEKLRIPIDQAELFIKEFNKFIKNELNDYGYTFINGVEISLKGFEWAIN